MVTIKAKILLLSFFLLIIGNNVKGQSTPSAPSTTLTPTEICKEQNFEQLIIAYPEDPNKFIICANNKGTESTCGTECFDTGTTKCIACPPASANNPCTGKDALDVVSDNCQNYNICMGGTNGDSVTIICPAHQHYCEREQKCTAAIEADCLPINKWCREKPNGLKFEATKCYEYYECWNNKITLQTCPYNQHFHKDKRMCVAGSCANEDGTTTERLPKCTIDTEGKKMPHSKCYKYYVCLNGIIYTGQCGAGYYFNEESKTCVKDIYDVCNDE